MKNAYFTPETIIPVAKKMAKTLQPITRSIPFNPKQAALLVLDMQSFFLNPDSHAFIPSVPSIIPGINSLIQLFSQAKRPIIATRHTNSIENAGNMKTWWHDLMLIDNPMTQLSTEIDFVPAHIIEKHRYDAFIGTDLDQFLAKSNVKQIVITGVMTHICCDSTARSAFQKGFNVFFCIDGTATYNEDFHRSSLLTLSHCCVVPVLINNISDVFLRKLH
ncbi:isochorismatase family protein [bacterium]|nr:isochorismatase family protein [bacterium]